MHTVENSLLSYLPDHVLQSIIDYDDVIGIERRMHVVTLFADVSGFTAISEALGKTGKSGAEELVRILNSYFDPMIALIRTYGGIIAKFGGDAMTVLFPYDDDNVDVVVRRAVQCAVDMQTRMVDYIDIPTSVGAYSLAMKAGLAMGPVLTMTVGKHGERLEYIVAGEAIDLCADAEHHADKGDVVLHNALLAHTGPVEIVREEDDFTQIKRLHSAAAIILPPATPAPPAARLPVVRDYIPPPIAQRILEGRSSFIGEHRHVTVLFVSFGGFDYDADPQVGSALQTYLGQVIEVIYRYDGTLNKVDMGDKGSKYIILFGAPIGHEDDEIRALRCAWELSQLDVPARIGVNSGFVFCGQVGSAVRQEYTVMGDAVNMAARLMQYASAGEIIVSDSTYRPATAAFQWGEPQSITVKGKTVPVTIRQLSGTERAQGTHYHEIHYPYPMVGREAEKQAAATALAAVQAGRGQITGISGAAGTGKSRLTAYMIDLARHAGLTIVGGECESFGTNTSYLVWQGIWRGLFDLPPEADTAEQITALTQSLTRINPAFGQRLPLLAPVLNLPIPDNGFTASLDTKTRLDLTFSLLLDCLRARGAQQPLLIILEDCHWMDPISQQLLEFLGRNITNAPIWMLMVYRQEDAILTSAPLRGVLGYGHFNEMRLSELSATDAENLMGLKLQTLTDNQGETIAPELLRQIMDKAQGNPFYIEEIINYIHDKDLDLSTATTLDLPATLHSLIISRIDSLSEAEQTTVKVASVIGRFFPADWTWRAYPQVGTAATVRAQLARLDRLDITPMHNLEDYEYMFKHITTHEVAYDSLAFATRAMLHERVGNYVEKTYAKQIEQYVDTLAHHFSRSENATKKRDYLLKAARHAQAIYANDAAIDYFQQVLPLLEHAQKAAALVDLGEVLQHVGQWDQARGHYEEAYQLAEQHHDPYTVARAKNALGMLLANTESPDAAMPWLQAALTLFDDLNRASDQVDVLRNIGLLYLRQGEFDEALRYFDRVLEFDDPRGEVEANLARGYAHVRQGKIDDTLADFQTALSKAIDIDYKQGIYSVNNDLAGLYFMQGQLKGAIDACNQALQITQDIGLLEAVGGIRGNLGEVYRMRGEYNQAITCYTNALNIALDLGDLRGMFYALGNMSAAFLAQKHYDTAQRLVKLAITVGETLNASYELCEYLHTHTQTLFYQGQVEAAITVNQRALKMAEDVGNEGVMFQVRMWSYRLGAVDASAGKNVNALMAMLADDTPPDQQAQILFTAWQIDQARDDLRTQAADLFRELHAQTPNAAYRESYLQLTGDQLPAPPKLPSLQVDTAQVTSLDDLLNRAEAQVTQSG